MSASGSGRGQAGYVAVAGGSGGGFSSASGSKGDEWVGSSTVGADCSGIWMKDPQASQERVRSMCTIYRAGVGSMLFIACKAQPAPDCLPSDQLPADHLPACLCGLCASMSAVQEYEEMLRVLQLSGLQKTTARLIEGMEIRHTAGDRFEVAFLTVVPFFRVTEANRFNQPVNYMRRDLRPGKGAYACTHARMHAYTHACMHAYRIVVASSGQAEQHRNVKLRIRKLANGLDFLVHSAPSALHLFCTP